MKREREGTEASPTAASSRAVSPTAPPPRPQTFGHTHPLNGALRSGYSVDRAPSNGRPNSAGVVTVSRSNMNGNGSAAGRGEGAGAVPMPKKQRMGGSSCGGGEEGEIGVSGLSSSVRVVPLPSSQSPLSSSPSTAVPPVSASGASGSVSSSSKRPKFATVEEPEGWRGVAEALMHASKQRRGSIEEIHQSGKVGGVGSNRHGVKSPPSATSRRKFSVVCSANFNRSMMAHKFLRDNRFRVESYGTGRDVRLPGKDHNSPEIFAFGTPYLEIYDKLQGKDEEFFRRNNLLGLVARNASIKTAPQRFQEIGSAEVAEFDVVLCFDSRVFYLVVEDLQSRDPELFKPLHVVNMTIKDSPEESALAAGDVLDICKTLDGMATLEEEAACYLEHFAKRTKRTILHQVCHV